MASEVLASDAQQALFRKWAQESVFVLDIHKTPSSQFCVLAKLLDWVEGERTWCSRWQECFGEGYTSHAPAVPATDASATPDVDPEDATHPASTASDTTLERSTTPAITTSSVVPGLTTTPPSALNTKPDSTKKGKARRLRKVSVSVWSQFPGFVTNPTASFLHEFRRLSKHMEWTHNESRRQRIKIFNADWEAHIGSELENLAHWQELCRLCSIDPIPTEDVRVTYSS